MESKLQYQKEKEKITDQIQGLKNTLRDLELKYIEENRPFNYGDRVNVINTGNSTIEEGIVRDFEVDWLNNIKTNVCKIKKDGTSSQHKIYVYSTSIIEKQ